jgi:hypothetical protein
MTTDPAELLAQIATDRQRSVAVDERTQRTSEEREAEDRSHITRTLMGTLRWGLPATVVMLLLLAWLDSTAASEAIKAVVEIFKAVLLPVITLVLGYYFGRGGKV